MAAWKAPCPVHCLSGPLAWIVLLLLLVWGCTHLCSGLTSGSSLSDHSWRVQRLYGVLGVEPESATCQASTLPLVSLLQLPKLSLLCGSHTQQCSGAPGAPQGTMRCQELSTRLPHARHETVFQDTELSVWDPEPVLFRANPGLVLRSLCVPGSGENSAPKEHSPEFPSGFSLARGAPGANVASRMERQSQGKRVASGARGPQHAGRAGREAESLESFPRFFSKAFPGSGARGDPQHGAKSAP